MDVGNVWENFDLKSVSLQKIAAEFEEADAEASDDHLFVDFCTKLLQLSDEVQLSGGW